MSPVLQLLILAGIALFLIFKLRGLLGTRDGFEGPAKSNYTIDQPSREVQPEEEKVDQDIIDFVSPDSVEAKSLAAMKKIDQQFVVRDFLEGATKAYEWILSSFGKGQIEDLKPFLSAEVFESFKSGVEQRDPVHNFIVEIERVKAKIIADVKFDEQSHSAEITVEFVSDLYSYVEDESGEVIDGDKNNSVSQTEEWTFSRVMGSKDPNWKLVATS
ncbi:MAG: Tim44/TimA family putative adaptor protein [Rhodobacteraceae bacterium]|nr:Tim44/TimA family putative adaptor protein [Paracoccaceae bacterium]